MFTYVTVDDAVVVVKQIGLGAELAKVDIRSAYHIIPVPVVTRDGLGRSSLHRHSVTVWATISPQDI